MALAYWISPVPQAINYGTSGDDYLSINPGYGWFIDAPINEGLIIIKLIFPLCLYNIFSNNYCDNAYESGNWYLFNKLDFVCSAAALLNFNIKFNKSSGSSPWL